MSEVIRLLTERGEIEEESGASGPRKLEMPRSVLEVVRQRLNLLSKEARQVLSDASLIGRDFDLRLLRILSRDIAEVIPEIMQVLPEVTPPPHVGAGTGPFSSIRFHHDVFQGGSTGSAINVGSGRLALE